MTTGTKTCRRCGQPIPAGALGGNCPRCLVQLAISTVSDGEEASRTTGRSVPTEATQPQRFFADYEISGELARGGMGVVYRARQVSLNRPVALKMIAAGQFATPAQVQRFRLEAEAAARLDHPHIVPIYEVGEHQGHQFYSMKLIEGGNLAQQAEEGRFSDARRIAELVAKLGRAVYYAHQRGVLHRDLKPTNILIDTEGEPHITDFGLAKLVEEDSSLTQTTAVLGTPAYMAPELASGKAAQATTAADTYSLGAILYELLTAQPPFIAENVPALLRKIVDEEPTPPSKLRAKPGLDRDLETIGLKCLAKDPAQRYRSAQAMVDDLECWLLGEPILARPASIPEKFGRWCRRKPMLAGLSLALGATVIGGLIITSVLFLRERQARQRASQAERQQAQLRAQAETEADKSRQLAKFLQQMLERTGPSVALGRDTVLLREILDHTAARIEQELSNQPAIAAELRETIGRTYNDLTDYAQAIAMLRENVRLRRQLSGNEHPDLAQALHYLAQPLAATGALGEAEALNVEALKIWTKAFGPESAKAAASLNNIGDICFRRRDFSQARQKFEQALRIFRNQGHADTMGSLNNLANVMAMQSDLAGAEKLHREAISLARQKYGDTHPTTALYLRNLGEILRAQGKLVEADAMQTEALAVRATLFDELHPWVADSLEAVAQVKYQRQEWTEAEELYRKALTARRKRAPDDPQKWDSVANTLADLLNGQQQFEETERLLSELLAGTSKTNAGSARLWAIRGSARARHGQWRKALPDLIQAVQFDPANDAFVSLLAPLMIEAGNPEAYAAFCRDWLQKFGETQNPDAARAIALACLLVPVKDLDNEKIRALARLPLAALKEGGTPYAVPVAALADYRGGHAGDAVTRLEELIQRISQGKFRRSRMVDVQTRAVLAMAVHELGDDKTAHKWLKEALEIAPAKIEIPSNGDYSGSWPEWLVLNLHLREAQSLLSASNVAH
jgi:tetratricopeptide (TPR) repeat protein/predicted Ser/Thr protein kinase